MKRTHCYVIAVCIMIPLIVVAQHNTSHSQNGLPSLTVTPTKKASTIFDPDHRFVSTGAPDFDVRLNRRDLEIKPGEILPNVANLAFSISPTNNFKGRIHLFAVAMHGDHYSSELPTGIHISIPRQSVNIQASAPLTTHALMTVDMSALKYPGIYDVALLAAQGKMNRRADLQIRIPATPGAHGCNFVMDNQDIETEHSGVYGVQIAMNAPKTCQGKIKLGLYQSSVDNILSAKPSSHRITYRFDPAEISMTHPNSTLHITVPREIPANADYHLVVAGVTSQGERILRPLTMDVVMNDLAVINFADTPVVETHLPIFSREWFNMITDRKERIIRPAIVEPSFVQHNNVVSQELLAQLYAHQKASLEISSHPSLPKNAHQIHRVRIQ